MAVCTISVTVDITSLVMSTEHVIPVGIGPVVLQSVRKVTKINLVLLTTQCKYITVCLPNCQSTYILPGINIRGIIECTTITYLKVTSDY